MLVVSEEVREAVDARRPVVALESMIIAHGLPRPRNLQVALELEDVVRQEGAVPATIAVLDGRPHVGLEKEQLARQGPTRRPRSARAVERVGGRPPVLG